MRGAHGWQAFWSPIGERHFAPPSWPLPKDMRVTKIVLTIAHKDHDPTNNAEENLAAWCQFHHLKWDQELHRRHARETRRRQDEQAARAQLELFPADSDPF